MFRWWCGFCYFVCLRFQSVIACDRLYMLRLIMASLLSSATSVTGPLFSFLVVARCAFCFAFVHYSASSVCTDAMPLFCCSDNANTHHGHQADNGFEFSLIRWTRSNTEIGRHRHNSNSKRFPIAVQNKSQKSKTKTKTKKSLEAAT